MKKIRIKKGKVEGYNPFDMIDKCYALGMTEEDIRKYTEFDLDYSSCYYEGDRPSIVLEWNDIYES